MVTHEAKARWKGTSTCRNWVLVTDCTWRRVVCCHSSGRQPGQWGSYLVHSVGRQTVTRGSLQLLLQPSGCHGGKDALPAGVWTPVTPSRWINALALPVTVRRPAVSSAPRHSPSVSPHARTPFVRMHRDISNGLGRSSLLPPLCSRTPPPGTGGAAMRPNRLCRRTDEPEPFALSF